MFTPEYFAQLSKTMEVVHQYIYGKWGQPLYKGSPRVEIVLQDGKAYPVRSFIEEPGAEFAQDVLTFLAHGSEAVPVIMVSVPYRSIARVIVYEPAGETPDRRIVGFQLAGTP